MTAASTVKAPPVSGPIPISTTGARVARLGIRWIALGYLAAPARSPGPAFVFYRTFEHGLKPVIEAIQNPDFQHAFWLTVTITLIAVPVNTVFGIIAALSLVRKRFPGRGLSELRGRPAARRVAGRGRSLCSWSTAAPAGSAAGGRRPAGHLRRPGMVLATGFVSLPLVVREVVPVLPRSATTRSRRPTRSARSPSRPSGGSPSRRSVGPGLRRRALAGAGPRRVRGREDRLRQLHRGDRPRLSWWRSSSRTSSSRRLRGLGRARVHLVLCIVVASLLDPRSQSHEYRRPRRHQAFR